MRITTRAAIDAWLDGLVQNHRVVAPQLCGDQLSYGPVESASDIALEFERTVTSAKKYLFPDSEAILQIEKRGGEISLAEHVEDQIQVLFAVRPCDARAFRALDAVLIDRSGPQVKVYVGPDPEQGESAQ